jgi:hypothetical protein
VKGLYVRPLFGTDLWETREMNLREAFWRDFIEFGPCVALWNLLLMWREAAG